MQEGQQLYSSYLVNCILNSFFCYTAIVLNIVTIQAIRKTSSLSKTLKTMLLSLAVSDLCVGLMAQPLYIALCVMDFKQVSNNDSTYNITINASVISGYLFAAVSFLNVMTLIADRFLVIQLHFRYQELVTSKRVVSVVIFIWLFSAILSLIRVLIPKNIFHIFFGIIMLACIIITTFLSVKIYFNVRRHMNHIQALQEHQAAQNSDMANIVRLRKFAIVAVYVYLVILACYLPNACVRFVVPFISASRIEQRRLQLYTETLVFLNSSLNPLIYCWKMKHIRHTIINIIRNSFFSHN